MVDNSYQSAITEKDGNSFVVTLYDINQYSIYDQDNLYYLEPKIFDLIQNIDNKLSIYGLEVFASDFGHSDSTYQLIITKKGYVLTYSKDRYEEDGTPLAKKKW